MPMKKAGTVLQSSSESTKSGFREKENLDKKIGWKYLRKSIKFLEEG